MLEENQLVTRTLEKRLKKVTPLHESGSNDAYSRPDGSRSGVYFVLPNEFWTRELHATLSWPALAVLLILLKESSGRDWAELAVDRAQKYYGISRTTAEEGLAELRKLNLLESRDRYVIDHDASEGRRMTSLHVLAAPFSMAYRSKLQLAAQQRTTSAGKSKKAKERTKKSRKEVNDDRSEKRG